MSRVTGALGKAVFLRVSLADLNKRFGGEAMIDISLENHGSMFGVSRNDCPRSKIVVWGEAPVVAPPSSIHLPAAPKVFSLQIPNNSEDSDSEKGGPIGEKIDLDNY